MSEQGQERKERYRRVRSEFDDLETEDKVLFLMEAAVSTIARGVDEFGRAVSDELNKAFSRRAERRRRHDEGSGKTAAGSSENDTSSSTEGTMGSTGSTSGPSGSAPNGSDGGEFDNIP